MIMIGTGYVADSLRLVVLQSSITQVQFKAISSKYAPCYMYCRYPHRLDLKKANVIQLVVRSVPQGKKELSVSFLDFHG